MPQFETGSAKLSISSIVAPQQTRVTTADDVNNLLGTVAKTTDDMVKVVDNETMTDKSRRYNEARAAYQKGLETANGDPFATNEVWGKFKADTQALIDEGGFISEESQNKLQGVIINEISQRELYHNNIQKQYQDARHKDSVAERRAASNEPLAAVIDEEVKLGALYNKKDKNEIMKTLLEVETSKMQYEMANSQNLDKEMIDKYRQSILSIKDVDPKVVGKDYFTKALGAVEVFDNAYNKEQLDLVSKNLNYGVYDAAPKLFQQHLKELNIPDTTKQILTTGQQVRMKKDQEANAAKALSLALQANESWDVVKGRAIRAGYTTEQLSSLKLIHENELKKIEDKAIVIGLKNEQAATAAQIDNFEFNGDPKTIIKNSVLINGVAEEGDLKNFERAGFQTAAHTDPVGTFSKPKAAYSVTVAKDYEALADQFATRMLENMQERGIDSAKLTKYIDHVKTTGKGGMTSMFVGSLLSTDGMKAYRTEPMSQKAVEAKQAFINNIRTIDKMVGTIADHNSDMVNKIFSEEQLKKFNRYKTLIENGNLSITTLENIDNMSVEKMQAVPTKKDDKLVALLLKHNVPPQEFDSYKKELQVIYNIGGDVDKFMNTTEQRLKSSSVTPIMNFKGARDNDGKPLVITSDDDKVVERALSIMNGSIEDIRQLRSTFSSPLNATITIPNIPMYLWDKAETAIDFVMNKGDSTRFDAKASIKLGGENIAGKFPGAEKVTYDKKSGGVYLGDDKEPNKYFLEVTPREFLDISNNIMLTAEKHLRSIDPLYSAFQDTQKVIRDGMKTAKTKEEHQADLARLKRVVLGRTE